MRHRCLDPAFDEAVVQPALPHASPMDGLVRKLCVDLSLRCPELESALHGGHEGLAVVLQGVRVTDLIPELTLPGRIWLQVRRPPQEGDSVIDLVAAHGERGGSPRPGDGTGAQSLDQLVHGSRPERAAYDGRRL